MPEAKVACSACRTRPPGSDHSSEGKIHRCPLCGARIGVGVQVSNSLNSGSARSWPWPWSSGLVVGWAASVLVAIGLASLARGPGQRSGGRLARPPAAVAKTVPPPVIASRTGPGRELFLREWMPGDSRSHGGDGLGPVFNDSSCVACHNLGGVGGGGPNGKNVDILSISDRDEPRSPRAGGGRAGGVGDDPSGRIHPGFRTATSVVLHRYGISPEYDTWRLDRLGTSGGDGGPREARQLQDGPPETLAKLDIERSRLPSGPPTVRGPGRSGRNLSLDASVARSQRNTTALFGVGLIDSIPDRVLEAAAARRFPGFPDIRGRVGRSGGGKIGRFGWKAQMPTLREFVLTACAVELGLEVPDHRQGGDPLEPDRVARGLDLTAGECDALVGFMASLPAPERQIPTGVAEVEAIREGERSFGVIGCATCHSPSLGEVVGIYSDLLLHDMGTDLSDTGSYRASRPESPGPNPSRPGPLAGGPPQEEKPSDSGASRGEWRTPPLWGVRDSGPYLHDGRADTLDQAIALHGGQGKDPATRYFGLPPSRRQQVRAFLKSLVAPVDPPPTPARLAKR
jgi:CxxC motif-containing protein (DUF1111 family)